MKQVFRSRSLGWATGLAMVAGMVSVAGAQQDDHGRKWKPLPPLSHIVVTVVKGFDGKPLPNAAVVFHATMNGRDDGNMEVKTNPEGKATIDVIEVGSDVSVQVIANGFATFAQDINVVGANKVLDVKLVRPREQVSRYQDNSGKAAQVRPGVQEPPHPVLAPAKPAGDQPLAPPPSTPVPQTPQTGTPQ
jgi:Carboxypeptidase regulatory-like domain